MKPRCIAFFLFLALASGGALAAKGPSLLDMSDQLDKIEKQDFQAAIDRANACIRSRNFPCAEAEHAKAAKAANSAQDRTALAASRQGLANAKQQLANEIRQREMLAQAEARRVEQEAREREEEEEQERRAQEEQEAEHERRERLASDEEDRQSTSEYYAAIGAQILQRGADDAARLNRIDRQTNAALDESRRVRAEQAAARESERAAAREARRVARETRPSAPAYQPQAVVIPPSTSGQRTEQGAGRAGSGRAGAGGAAGAEATNDTRSDERRPTVWRNPGESAQRCVSARSTGGGKVAFTNNCGEKVFVIWCGDLKHTKKRCGDGPKGGFYTHSENIGAGDEATTDVNGPYRYAACKGSISFGNDGEYQDNGSGGVQCLKR